MLGVVADPVADAEYRLRSIVRNDKSICSQVATVKQSALFHRNHKEHKQ
jgi:hypothetical protein